MHQHILLTGVCLSCRWICHHCITPRLLYSTEDALLCATFVRLLCELQLPHFSIVSCLDQVQRCPMMPCPLPSALDATPAGLLCSSPRAMQDRDVDIRSLAHTISSMMMQTSWSCNKTLQANIHDLKARPGHSPCTQHCTPSDRYNVPYQNSFLCVLQ